MPAVEFLLNGRQVSVKNDGGRTLLWVLRTDFALTGAKYGCGEGYCGACTVVLDGKAVRSCQTALRDVAGKHVVTIEGLGSGASLHPLQQAFIEHGGFQCGYCTSGMLLTAAAFLGTSRAPSRDAIEAAMENNLCRCGAHTRIIAAILSVAKQMKVPV